MRVGVDIISVDRLRRVIERHPDRFLDRVFTIQEQAICHDDPRRLAGRYAAKEAIAKALGTGIGRLGIRFHDIEILQEAWGGPKVRLHKAALKRFQAIGSKDITLSLSHEDEYAVAFCVITLGTNDDAR